MTHPPTTISYDHLIRARLRALTVRHGYGSFTGLSAAMGYHRTWLRRKLDPRSARPTPVTLAVVDEVLAFLGESPSAVMAPVLLPGDLECLEYMLSPGVTKTQAAIGALFANGDVIVARLVDQGLLIDGEGALVVTDLTDLALALGQR